MKLPLRLEKQQQATSMAAAADISFTSRASQHEHERHELQPREYTNHACCTNCVISTALAAILCRRRCDADRVVADFAFFPPSPPTYLLVKREDGSVSQLEWKYRDLERSSLFSRFRQLDGKDGRALCSPLRTSRKEVVPTFFFDYGRRGFCVIYFHANATDCGAMLPTYAAFSSRLGVSVLAVEYSGYGGSTGRPSVANTLADARAAYEEARRLGFDASRIILYGQSVGSGPACYLASRCQVAGVILHSPIASGIRSLTGGGCCSPIYVFKCLDPYNNLKELKRSQAPVFVIHGTADEEIPFQHGQMLHDVARTKYPPSGFTRQDTTTSSKSLKTSTSPTSATFSPLPATTSTNSRFEKRLSQPKKNQKQHCARSATKQTAMMLRGGKRRRTAQLLPPPQGVI